MPNYRRATIYAEGNPGVSGNLIVPIYLQELVSRIHFRFAITINTVSVMTGLLAGCISKLELVDGSTVLFSASGPEMVADNYFRTGSLPKEHKSLTVGDIAYFDAFIYFGNMLWDQNLAWDPTKFTAPQLRITFDGTYANAGVTVVGLAIYADIIDNPAKAPSGIILVKDQTQYALAASSHEYIDLPVDYATGIIYLRLDSDAHQPTDLMANVKFSRDQDAFIWLDQPLRDYVDGLSMRYPPIEQAMVLDDAVTADTIFVVPTQDQYVQVDYDSTPFVTASSHFATPTFTGKKLALSASVDIQKLTAKVRGTLPHGVVPFFFGDKDDITSWYKPAATTKFRADFLTSALAAGTDIGYLYTAQYRPY